MKSEDVRLLSRKLAITYRYLASYQSTQTLEYCVSDMDLDHLKGHIHLVSRFVGLSLLKYIL